MSLPGANTEGCSPAGSSQGQPEGRSGQSCQPRRPEPALMRARKAKGGEEGPGGQRGWTAAALDTELRPGQRHAGDREQGSRGSRARDRLAQLAEDNYQEVGTSASELSRQRPSQDRRQPLQSAWLRDNSPPALVRPGPQLPLSSAWRATGSWIRPAPGAHHLTQSLARPSSHTPAKRTCANTRATRLRPVPVDKGSEASTHDPQPTVLDSQRGC